MRIAGLYSRKSKILVLQNLTTTFFITLTLASLNCADKSVFLFFWMRSWMVAGLISNFFSFVVFSKNK